MLLNDHPRLASQQKKASGAIALVVSATFLNCHRPPYRWEPGRASL